MSALSSWHGWPTAAQAIVRSRSTQLLATASSTRPLMHAPAPSRRAAVACAPPSSSSRHYHATQAAEHDHIDMDEFEEPLSAAAREDLERALHPVWEELREQSHWQQEQEQGEQVYSGTEFGEEDGAEWKEWVRELQAEAMAQRPIPPPVPPPAPPPPVKIAATQSTTPMTDRPAATSTRPAPQALPPVEGLIRSRMDLTVSPIAPYRPPTPSSSKRKPRPDELPLLSRADWRLSSPIRRPPSTVRSRPPSLWKPEDTSRQGHNKLVGVGVDCSKVGIWNRQMETEEQWGWKVKVPKGEKGAWPAADVHRRRLDRLLALTAAADEVSYIQQLARSGTPEERELLGMTVCRARGKWLTNATRAEAMAKLSEAERKALSNEMGAGGAKAIAEWWEAGGRSLGEEEGWKFPHGAILRFTPLDPEQSNGPQAPVSAAPKHPQGTVLEAREGKLVVAFKEADMWVLGDGEYRIDLGLDDSSYALQASAIDNLYYSPSHQRVRNAQHVQHAQDAHAEGVASILREWQLVGTDVRELIVPDLEESAQAEAIRRKEDDPSAELFEQVGDRSPAAEIAHLPQTIVPLPPRKDDWQSVNPSSLFSDNQLINSWIKRHERDRPMSITGDPVLRLNESQTKAVAMSLGEKLSLIQGPPGTGKSQTIVSIIALLKLHFRIPQPILLAAPTHVSTDHLLSLLISAGLNPLRSGKASRVREDLQAWTVEKRREEHPLWERLEKAREESEKHRVALHAFKEKTMGAAGTKLSAAVVQQGLDLEAAYRRSWRKYIALEQRLYSSLFATADVFCGTAIGSGASKVMSMVDFPIVFLDEAAMCTEPVTLIPLMKGAEHVTLIGDHKQLPAVVKSREAVKERLHVSLFERLMQQQTVKSTLLDTQYRMHPTISAFPNSAFYNSALHDSTTLTLRPGPPLSAWLDPAHPSAFISHSYPETSFRQSTRNLPEAQLIVEVVGDLLACNPSLRAEDIGIISPYYAQTKLLQRIFQDGEAGRTLRPSLGWERAREVEQVEVNTVDGFQGREKGIIILSTVRSNARGQIGFLTDARRLNVALTRAKEALFVVGNARTLKSATVSEWRQADPESDADVWRRYLTWLEQRGLVKEWEGGAEVEAVEELRDEEEDHEVY